MTILIPSPPFSGQRELDRQSKFSIWSPWRARCFNYHCTAAALRLFSIFFRWYRLIYRHKSLVDAVSYWYTFSRFNLLYHTHGHILSLIGHGSWLPGWSGRLGYDSIAFHHFNFTPPLITSRALYDDFVSSPRLSDIHRHCITFPYMSSSHHHQFWLVSRLLRHFDFLSSRRYGSFRINMHAAWGWRGHIWLRRYLIYYIWLLSATCTFLVTNFPHAILHRFIYINVSHHWFST